MQLTIDKLPYDPVVKLVIQICKWNKWLLFCSL